MPDPPVSLVGAHAPLALDKGCSSATPTRPRGVRGIPLLHCPQLSLFSTQPDSTPQRFELAGCGMMPRVPSVGHRIVCSLYGECLTSVYVVNAVTRVQGIPRSDRTRGLRGSIAHLSSLMSKVIYIVLSSLCLYEYMCWYCTYIYINH